MRRIAVRTRLITGRLMAQFVILAGVVLVAGMIGTGMWVSAQIERIVTSNAGAVTALYVDSMVAPAVQELAERDALGPATSDRLGTMLQQGALSREISAFKIWDTDGRIIYSDRPEIIGRRFPDNPRLAVALAGQVHAELRDVADPVGYGASDGQTQKLMEVYSPIRSARTGEVIAVAEFYTTTEALRADLLNSRIQSWIIVGAVTFAMFVALYAMFARGDRTIRRQRSNLDARIAELSDLLEKNAALNARVEQANQRIARINDQTLHRLSADLHDGPAQLLAFAALRLDGVEGQEQVAEAVNEALHEIRLICHGLVLPELESWTVATIARRLVGTHEARTGAHVSVQIDTDIPDMPLPQKNCVYRFLQETLHNGAKHAPGAEQHVVIRRRGDEVEVSVTDDGPGFDPGTETRGLGLMGLRERVASLNGRFTLNSAPGQGTHVAMGLPVAKEGRRT